MNPLGIFLAFAMTCAFSMAWAEDPLLGIFRGVKCLNCVPDSVVLQVEDPIENQELEVRVPTREYNKILTPLRGRSLYMKQEEGCFYWQIKLKIVDTTQTGPAIKPTSAIPDSTSKLAPEPRFKQSSCIPYSATSLGMN